MNKNNERKERFAHVTRVHPCFNEKVHDKVGRIHIPIAPACNIQCGFCTRDINTTEDRPGVAAGIMNIEQAMKHIKKTIKKMPISVIGVAGPGDALYNPNTLKLFNRINKELPHLTLCMSTNGLLVPEYAEKIKEAGVKTVTITINAINPETGVKIYDDINYHGKIYHGKEGFELLLKNQLKGIEMLDELGIIVKVNTVLIPTVNDEEILKIAEVVRDKGASIMNVLPIIPLNKFKGYPIPDCDTIWKVRNDVEEIIPVFRSCSQCRADAFGIPGHKTQDYSLDLTPMSHY